MSRRFTKAQKAWVDNYKQCTGFEVMCIEDFRNKSKTFGDFAQLNVDWFESWASEQMRAIDIPFELSTWAEQDERPPR